jgi:hypothetical protein
MRLGLGHWKKKWATRGYEVPTGRGEHCGVSAHPGVADLGAVGVDGSRAVDLPQLALHVSESHTHVPGVLIWKDLDGK